LQPITGINIHRYELAEPRKRSLILPKHGAGAHLQITARQASFIKFVELNIGIGMRDRPWGSGRKAAHTSHELMSDYDESGSDKCRAQL